MSPRFQFRLYAVTVCVCFSYIDYGQTFLVFFQSLSWLAWPLYRPGHYTYQRERDKQTERAHRKTSRQTDRWPAGRPDEQQCDLCIDWLSILSRNIEISSLCPPPFLSVSHCFSLSLSRSLSCSLAQHKHSYRTTALNYHL